MTVIIVHFQVSKWRNSRQRRFLKLKKDFTTFITADYQCLYHMTGYHKIHATIVSLCHQFDFLLNILSKRLKPGPHSNPSCDIYQNPSSNITSETVVVTPLTNQDLL